MIKLSRNTRNPEVTTLSPVVSPPMLPFAVWSSAEIILATASTPAEAETARLAFERVLLPRFTADEAIAIVKAATGAIPSNGVPWVHGFKAATRATLEALAAAGVFVPDGAVMVCPECRHDHRVLQCAACNTTGRVPQTMADKLDQAGIR